MKVLWARLERAAQFVAHLHKLTRDDQHSWRRSDSIGRDIGLLGAHLDQAVDDAEHARLIDRRVDDPNLVILTSKGRAMAEGMPDVRA